MQKCWICGKEAVTHRNIGVREPLFSELIPFADDTQRCYCEKCFEDVMQQYKVDTAEYVRLKKKMMFERAVRILEKQHLDIYEYQEAIKAVEEFAAEKPDKFDSAYEMIAAIILIHHQIHCKLQFKVGKYQCDFCIPSIKVILEIDGERHKHKKDFDSERDLAIRKELGFGWEIIRIKTEYLDKKAEMLIEAIKAVLEKRRTKR